MKTCSKCKQSKPLTEFSTDNSRKDGKRPQCKQCIKSLDKSYQANNKDHINQTSSIQRMDKRHNDTFYNTKLNITRSIRKSLYTSNPKPNTNTTKILGCTIPEFKLHLEKHFLHNMSWNNKNDWYIHHIIPLANATNIQELITLNHHSNLIPMWK